MGQVPNVTDNTLNTVLDFRKFKQQNRKISVVTCYDYTFGLILAESNIDCVLVGDSAAMTMHGYENTINATVDMLVAHTASVKRALPNKFIIADLPFLSYRKSLDMVLHVVQRLMQAGASAIKLEGASGNCEIIKHITQSGVPVMGHLGLTPQAIYQLGGFKVQGKEELKANKILEDALELESAGCFAIVLECIPNNVALRVTSELKIPTIGIGAGVEVDGQVLVLQDILGLSKKFKPKFVKNFIDGFEICKKALNEFDSEVKQRDYPTLDHSYE